MVSYQQLAGVNTNVDSSGNRLSSLNSALKTQIESDLAKRKMWFDLAQQGISSGASLVGQFLERKAERDQGKDYLEATLGMLSPEDVAGLDSGLQLQAGTIQAEAEGPAKSVTFKEGEPVKLTTGVTAQQPRNPKIVALEKLAKEGRLNPAQIQTLLADTTDLTNTGRLNTATSKDKMAEYEAKEDPVGTGNSRRRAAMDAEIAATNRQNTGSGAGGSAVKLTNKQRDQLASNATMGDLLNNLERDLQTVDQGTNQAGRIALGVGGLVGLGGDKGSAAAQINANTGLFKTMLASSVQSGNLTAAEQSAALKNLPQVGDPVSLQIKKIAALREILQTSQARLLSGDVTIKESTNPLTLESVSKPTTPKTTTAPVKTGETELERVRRIRAGG